MLVTGARFLVKQRDTFPPSYLNPDSGSLRSGDIANIVIGVVTAIAAIIVLLMKAWKFWSRETLEAVNTPSH